MAKARNKDLFFATMMRLLKRWWWLPCCLVPLFLVGALTQPQCWRLWQRIVAGSAGKNAGTRSGGDAEKAEQVLQQNIEKRVRAELEREFQQKKQQWQEQWAMQNSRESREPTVSDVRQLRQGLPLEFKVNSEPGAAASNERERADSYTARYQLNWSRPQAVTSLEGLQRLNPKLAQLLPRLPQWLAGASISPLYANLYDRKQARLLQDATDLQALLSKHNLYDLETALSLRDPSTKRRMLLMQADMDVVSDGSDGDRLASMPEEIVNSANYQPFTSYAWKKTGKAENPMIAGWQKRIQNAEQELAAKDTTAERKDWLKERIAYLKRGIADMRSRSFLIADHDPFIVLPVTWLAADLGADSVRPGDFCVVIHGDRCFPVIVGDGGPNYKCGEASLRLAKEIDARTNPYRRPVTDLKVTYLIFPGSRLEPREAPDYAKWRQTCQQLLAEVGGLGSQVSLHEWTSTLPPAAVAPVPVAPSPTPTPAPASVAPATTTSGNP